MSTLAELKHGKTILNEYQLKAQYTTVNENNVLVSVF